MFMIWGAFTLFFAIFMLILSFRAIYVAFVKKKDERSKWVVTKSMADSFIVLVILDTTLFIMKWLNYGLYVSWWSSFKESIYIEPVLFSFIILGIVLLINTKRYGGSL